MGRIGANNQTYNLLSDILKIAGEYIPLDIKNALNHLEQTSKGDYHDIMITLLKKFEILTNLPDALSLQPDNVSDKSDSGLDKSPKEEDSSSSSDKTKPVRGKIKRVPKEDPKIKKLRNMLEDSDVINSKKDIVKIIQNYFKGIITLRPDNKDSKRDLIAKIISEYKKLESAQKQKIYSAIRRFYLRKRKSNLSNG